MSKEHQRHSHHISHEIPKWYGILSLRKYISDLTKTEKNDTSKLFFVMTRNEAATKLKILKTCVE